MSDDYSRILKYLSMKPDDPGAYEDGLAVIYDHIKRGDETFRAHNKEYRKMITGAMRRLSGGELTVIERLNEAYYRSLLIDAQVSFDAYCLYIEKTLDPRKRFYRPRRSRLLTVVNSLQDLMDDRLDLLTVSLPPGVGKSSLAIFLLTWIAGKWSDEPNLTGSHSNAFVHGVYDECLRIFDPKGEYLWSDVFPGVGVTDTNAKDCRID